ncbi:zinc finger protein 692-like isoform 4-T4 [Amazona ochrocephala]
MDPGHPARQRAPDCVRRQKRRELDARRSKCRIRIGGHLERWCRLKEQLGFALHSQLAQFLLDRYSSHGCGWSPGEPGPGPVPAEALQRLVVLSHGHGQECGFVPSVKPPAPGSATPLVWECVAGHSFSWGEPGGEPGAAAPQEPAETGTAGKDHGSELIPEEKVEQGPEPQEEEEEEEEEEDFAEDDDLTYTDDLRDENYHPSLDSEAEPQRRPRQSKAPKDPIKEEQPPDELSLSSSSPSEERGGRVSCKRRTRASDEDVAQIGPKRIRKAAKREILLCDFEGCGKIFSNRQYLNHHKKYQHVHQKTFTCSEPSCGKSFNFKKHLKEHEKLHSGELGGTAHPNASLPAPEPISSALQTRGITSASSAPAPSAPAATSSSTGASTPGRSRCSARCAASRAARRPPSTGTCGSTAPPPRTASPASSAARGSRRGTTWRPTRARATPPRRPPPPRGRAVAGRWRASGCGMREHPQAQGWRRLVRRSHPPWAESSAMDKGDAGSTRSREGAVLPNAIPGFSAKP